MNLLRFIQPSVPPERMRQLEAGFKQLVHEGARGLPILWGMGPAGKTRYFVVGDEPASVDFVMRQPFSGGMSQVAMQLERSIKAKDGEDTGGFYYTYLVKAILPPGSLTEKDLMDLWLPALQYEYALSGCRDVACVGELARTIASLIPALPEAVKLPEPKGILARLLRF